LPEDTKSRAFTEFVIDTELRLRQALTASYGPEVGRDAAADALAYGWEHWDRVSVMDNPVGYLYRVGQTSARRLASRRNPVLPPVASDRLPWVEPGLPRALERLSGKQRQVVLMLFAYDWSMSEVAVVMDVSKATVQSHADRAMRKLRRWLGVAL
jgi:DNA-directed RNA polymerase specialized sigma24 family protein